MHTYAPAVIADQATGRPLAGVRVTVEDAETGAPVQPYRDGAPVQLVTGAYGLISEWQTDETTRRVALTAGSVRLTQWCEELQGTAADAVSLMDDRLAAAASAVSQAATIRDGLEPRVQTVEARQTALESAKGFGPSTPVDGQTASLVLQPGTQVGEAVSSVAAKRAGYAAAITPTFATPASSAGRQMTMSIPALVDERVIVTDDAAAHIVDGCQYFTMVEVGTRSGQWIDQWYGYVSGHGGYASATEKGYIWLVTAPTPYGPWTWHETPIIGTGDRPYLSSRVVGPRCIAPDVMWVGDELHLTFHGLKLSQPYTEGYDYTQVRNAPSVLATSTDGLHFTERGIVLDVEEGVDDASPYRASTSYRRTFRDGATWHTVWQANSTQANGGVGLPCYSVGHAVSADGETWVKQPPLAVPVPGDQGFFAPSVVRVAGGWLMLTQYRAGANGADPSARWYFADRLEPGAFQYLGPFAPPPIGGRTTPTAFMPFFLTYGGVLHVAWGGRTSPAEPSKISIAKVVWA